MKKQSTSRMHIENTKIGDNEFNNGDLGFDIENILSFDDINLSKSFDSNLEYQYVIDIKDTSYFYANKKERDDDFEKIKSLIK
jgi:hypothetical protein